MRFSSALRNRHVSKKWLVVQGKAFREAPSVELILPSVISVYSVNDLQSSSCCQV